MFPLKDNIPTDRFPVVTVAIIATNILMYLLFQKAGFNSPDEGNVVEFGAIPYELTHPGEQCVPVSETEFGCGEARGGELAATWQTLFTSMFMHGGFLHIAGNMLFLWIFGNNVEDAMGRVKFVLFYLLGGFAAIAAQTAIDPDSAIPTIGASGAVAAVLGGYILLYPRARVVTLVFIVFFITVIELPAMLMLGIWFLEQVVIGSLDYANPTGGGGGVAYFAHIGGFVFGLLTIKLWADRSKERKTVPPKYPVY